MEVGKMEWVDGKRNLQINPEHKEETKQRETTSETTLSGFAQVRTSKGEFNQVLPTYPIALKGATCWSCHPLPDVTQKDVL